jgi:hypothetical protein
MTPTGPAKGWYICLQMHVICNGYSGVGVEKKSYIYILTITTTMVLLGQLLTIS